MADLREKLVELLTEATRKWGCQMGLYGCMADHLIANGVTFARDINAPSWIPVTERLPDVQQDVLVCRGEGTFMDTDWMDCPGIWAGDSHYDDEMMVTHWMLLPEPPGDCHGLRHRNDGEVAGDG